MQNVKKLISENRRVASRDERREERMEHLVDAYEVTMRSEE